MALASAIGQKFKGGEVIELIGDLGGGKTAFVRGLAQGMGSQDKVSSPSFTISNQYTAGNLTLYHFDFYRLEEPGIIKQELEEVLGDDTAVVVIEWAEIVKDILPPGHLSIQIKTTGENTRQLTLMYPQELSHLTPVNT